jgi:hypothetical protein
MNLAVTALTNRNLQKRLCRRQLSQPNRQAESPKRANAAVTDRPKMNSTAVAANARADAPHYHGLIQTHSRVQRAGFWHRSRSTIIRINATRLAHLKIRGIPRFKSTEIRSNISRWMIVLQQSCKSEQGSNYCSNRRYRSEPNRKGPVGVGSRSAPIETPPRR